MINDVIDIAHEAGRIIEEVRRTAFAVEQKGSMGPVTEADRRADEFLRRELLNLKSAGWLSEETADNPERLSQSQLWVVDPLDGTKEFVEGVPQYSVAIALVEDGLPVLGVVHNPASGETAYAEKGGGAWVLSETGAEAKATQVVDGDIILASRSEVKRGEFEPFENDWDVREVGSIEYKLALIGMGKGAATVSRGPKWEWDVCAGSIIVAEAGGLAVDAYGGELLFNKEFPKVKGVLAGAPTAFEKVLSAVSEMGQSDRMDEFAGR